MSSAPASQVNFFGHSKNKIKDTDLFCASMVHHVSFKKTLQQIQTASLYKHKQVMEEECCFPDTQQSEVLQIKLRLQVSLDPSASTKVCMTHNDEVYESFERSMDVTQTNLVGNIPVAEHGTCVNIGIDFNGRTVSADQYIVSVQEADDTISTTSVHNNSFTLENNPQKMVLSVNFANIYPETPNERKLNFMLTCTPCMVNGEQICTKASWQANKYQEHMQSELLALEKQMIMFNTPLKHIQTIRASTPTKSFQDVQALLQTLHTKIQELHEIASASTLSFVFNDETQLPAMLSAKCAQFQQCSECILNMHKQLESASIEPCNENLTQNFDVDPTTASFILELMHTRQQTASNIPSSRFQTELSAVDNRIKYFTLQLIDETIRRFCSCAGTQCDSEHCKCCKWDKEPSLLAYQLQQMFANNKNNTQQIEQEVYDSVKDLILKCKKVSPSLACFPNSKICTDIQRQIMARSLTAQQSLPVATSSMYWYKTQQSVNMDGHPLVLCVKQIIPQQTQQSTAAELSQCNARVAAVKLMTRMWLDDKMHRIVSLATYNYFCNVLQQSICTEREPFCSINKSACTDATDDELEILACTDEANLNILKQALGLVATESIDVSHLDCDTVFAKEPSTGYNQDILAQLQLRLAMQRVTTHDT